MNELQHLKQKYHNLQDIRDAIDDGLDIEIWQEDYSLIIELFDGRYSLNEVIDDQLKQILKNSICEHVTAKLIHFSNLLNDYEYDLIKSTLEAVTELNDGDMTAVSMFIDDMRDHFDHHSDDLHTKYAGKAVIKE